MSDPVRNLAGLIPQRRAATPSRTRRSTVKRSGLAPLPRAHPFVSSSAKQRQALESFTAKLKGRRSITDQIGGVFAGLPAGAVHLAAGAGKTAAGVWRVPVDLAKGDLTVDQLINSGNDTTTMHKYFPLATEMYESFEDTVGRVAQLGPVEVESVGGRKVRTYGDKWREGDIVNALLGDALNATVVAGAAGKALGAGAKVAEGVGAADVAARLGRASDVAGVGARLGGRIANAPMEAIGGVMKGTRSAWRQGGLGVKEAIYRRLPEKSGRRIVRATTVEGRLLKEASQKARTVPYRFGNWMSTNLAKDAGMVDNNAPWWNPNRKSEGAPTLIEQEVGLTRAVGVAQADKMLSDLVGPKASIGAHVGPVNKEVPGQTMTREGQALHDQYVAGTLPPEVKARIDAVTEAYKKQVNENITPQALAGRGQKPLDPRQTGDGILDDAVSMHMAERIDDAKVMDALEELRLDLGQDITSPTYDPNFPDPPASWEKMQQALDGTPEGAILDQVLLDPQVYPAPWREAMNVFGQGQKVLDTRAARRAGINSAKDARVFNEMSARFPGMISAADMKALRQLRAEGATWADLGALHPEFDSLLAAPAIDALARSAPDWGGKVGTPYVPRTPRQLLNAGIERPTYMPGVKTALDDPTRIQTTAVTEGFSGVRKITAEQHRSTLGHGQYSLATASEALSKQASAAEFNHIIETYMQRAEIPSAGEILKRPAKDGSTVDLADLYAEAEAYANAQNLGGMAPAQLERSIRERYSQSILDELHQRGYDVLKGDRFDPKPGDFNPAETVNPLYDVIDVDSIALPIGLRDRLVPYRLGSDHNLLIALNTKGNAWFKRNVLPFNAHWTIGDMTSNLLMAWRSGAVTPVEMFAAGRRLKNLEPAAYENMFNRAEFIDAGLKYQTAKALNPLLDERAPARTPVGKAVRRGQEIGFGLNKMANRLQRHEYVYAKLSKELEHRGLDTIEGLGADSAKWKNPKVQKAIDDVVNDANNVLGTWDEMSPFEQRIATQVFPFWSWVRHITTLVGRTTIDSPTRVLWTLRVGAMGMSMTPEDLPEWMRGSVDTPVGRFNLSWANPFYDVGTGSLASPGAALRSTSPLIKAATTAVTGRDMGRNLNMVTHRPDTDPNQFGSALYGLTQASPFIRGAMNLAPTAEIPGLGVGLGPHRRYGSGQMILTPGTTDPADNQSRGRMAANMFNIPLPVAEQVVPQTAIKPRRKSGLGKSGLGSGRLKRTGLGSG